jgi:hypothetical protein
MGTIMARVIMTPGYEIKVQAATADEIHNLAKDIASDIRSNIRADNLIDTGALLGSVRVRKQSNGDSRVSIGTDHWAEIEYGTAPHVIVAPPGHVFTFVKKNGERVFTTRINHPGTRAYRIVRRAFYKKRGLRSG